MLVTDPRSFAAVELPGRGTTFACDQPGPTPDAPAVVLLHGWTATGLSNWAETMAALAAHWRVIVLDHRGHGRGIRGEDPFSLEDCADDAVALLDVLGVADAVFVGYSMGGPIAQLVWKRHRERVRGLVFCATAADFTVAAESASVVRALDELGRTSTLIPRWLRLQVAQPLAALVIADREVRARMWSAVRDHDEHVVRHAGRVIRHYDARDWIGEIDVPTVVVVTARDRLVDPARQRALADAIPGADVHTLDAAHLAPFTRPEAFAAAVAEACAPLLRRPAAAPAARWRERLRAWWSRRRNRRGDRRHR